MKNVKHNTLLLGLRDKIWGGGDTTKDSAVDVWDSGLTSLNRCLGMQSAAVQLSIGLNKTPGLVEQKWRQLVRILHKVEVHGGERGSMWTIDNRNTTGGITLTLFSLCFNICLTSSEIKVHNNQFAQTTLNQMCISVVGVKLWNSLQMI